MGSVKAGKFQTAICTILGFFGCKWTLLEVIFALLSQNKLLGGMPTALPCQCSGDGVKQDADLLGIIRLEG